MFSRTYRPPLGSGRATVPQTVPTITEWDGRNCRQSTLVCLGLRGGDIRSGTSDTQFLPFSLGVWSLRFSTA